MKSWQMKKKEGKTRKATWDDNDSFYTTDDDSKSEKISKICQVVMVNDNTLDSEEVSTTCIMAQDVKKESEVNDII